MSWEAHASLDRPFQGDRETILAPTSNDVGALKRICEERGYNAFLQHGLPGLKIAHLKSFDHTPTKFDCAHCVLPNAMFYIYERPADEAAQAAAAG